MARVGLIAPPAPRLLAHAEIRADSAGVTATEAGGGTDIIGLSLTVDSDGSPIWLSFEGLAAVDGAAGVTYAVVRIMEGAAEVQRQTLTSPVDALHILPAAKRVRITPTAGLHTYKINCFVITATSITLSAKDTATTKHYFNFDASTAPLAV
jgi:hypothetical protein